MTVINKIPWQEHFYLIGYAVILGFLFSFNKWGDSTQFEYLVGIGNLIKFSLISYILLYVLTFVHKKMLDRQHIEIKPTLSIVAIVLSVVICFISRGTLIIFVPPLWLISGQTFAGISRHESILGRSIRAFAAGVIALSIIGLIAVALSVGKPGFFLSFALVSFMTAFYSLIPFDIFLKVVDRQTGISAGSVLLFQAQRFYIFTIAFVVCAGLGTFFGNPLLALIFAIVGGGLVTLIWYFKSDLATVK